ncbi:MAG TPA: DUF72 domain-containing protein [Pyrinomonadaceae bacterium]|jgi:uncharacterized protein YecE (DUF72 family)
MSQSPGHINIGCCGFRSSRESYYAFLNSVEVQHTFYQPPQVSTLARWREEAPPDFVFTIKAWQLITHQSNSPTYRRLKRQLTETEKGRAGSFRPSRIVKEALDTTLACAQALKARAVLFQCPASFQPTRTNLENLRRFFTKTKRDQLTFCFEPRGHWPLEVTRDLCEELDLWHVVDPFKERTTTPTCCYFRLHGRGGWRYTYEDDELEELLSMLPEDRASYVFFNNREMLTDAVRFKEMTKRQT